MAAYSTEMKYDLGIQGKQNLYNQLCVLGIEVFHYVNSGPSPLLSFSIDSGDRFTKNRQLLKQEDT